MKINTVSIVGLGSLGIMYGHHLSKHMDTQNLRIVAERQRINRYEHEGVYCNAECCNFQYIDAEKDVSPADLLIFAVKFNDLPGAINVAKKQVGPHTVIISLLNGIGSEEIIGDSFGIEKVVYSVAQGMDATKDKNKVEYHSMGLICFGSMNSCIPDWNVRRVKDFFDEVDLPHEVVCDMQRRLWGKFMLNVGVNQTVAAFECDYGGILKNGRARDMMISAMKEVIILSEKENINLTQDDLDYWLRVLDGLNPGGKPSMRQDLEAHRKSEVELFSGAVLALSKKHNIESPVNQFFYDKIKAMENSF